VRHGGLAWSSSNGGCPAGAGVDGATALAIAEQAFGRSPTGASSWTGGYGYMQVHPIGTTKIQKIIATAEFRPDLLLYGPCPPGS
jgi:hypothetical protein